jgi:hypothetical protein
MREDGIPRSFKLAGHTIKVVTVPLKKWQWGDQVLAMWLPGELRIELRRDLEGTHRQQVFLHEAVHAILDCASYHELSANEDFVDRTSMMLHQMLTTMK